MIRDLPSTAGYGGFAQPAVDALDHCGFSLRVFADLVHFEPVALGEFAEVRRVTAGYGEFSNFDKSLAANMKRRVYGGSARLGGGSAA